MKKIEKFMLPEHTNNLYKNEAISSISLSKEVADKINELVNAYNELSEIDLSWKQEQEGRIRKGVLFMKDNLINSLNELLKLLESENFFDKRVAEYTAHLEERLNNLLGNIQEGSTSLDSEIIDARTGADSVSYTNLGESIRTQFENVFEIALNRINMSDYTNDMFIRKRNGTLKEGENFRISKPIEITHSKLFFAGAYHTFTDCDLINFYSSSDIKEKNFISSVTPSTANKLNEIKIPDGATHLVICTSISYWNITHLFFAGDLIVFSDIEKMNLKPLSLNGFVENSFIRNTNGSVASGSGYAYSEAIKLTHNKLFIKGDFSTLSSSYFINFYSNDEVSFYSWIGGYTPINSKLNEIPIPEGTTHIVISGETDIVKKATLFYAGELLEKERIKSINEIMVKVMQNKKGNTPIKIKVIGDSIANGLRGSGYTNNKENGELIYGSNYVNTKGHCWVNSLKAYLENKFNCSVINYGVSGVGSDILLSKMPTLIKEDDDIIICAIGTNDRVIGNDAYTGKPRTLESIYKNMNGLYTYAKRKNKEIIFITPIPSSVSDESKRRIHNEDIENLYIRLSVEKNIEIIPMYKKFVEYCETRGLEIDGLLNDGLHPNDAGYNVMYYLICNSLGFTTPRNGATW